MHITKDRLADSYALDIDGDISLQNIGELKQALLDAFNAANSVLLDVQGVTDIDISCLQLLCSAHRTSINQGKKIAIPLGLTGVFRNIIKRAGYERHTECSPRAFDTCLWKGVKHV